jgi:hypothetical protein
MHYLLSIISIINLFMFRAGLLLIMYYSVYTEIGICHFLCWLAVGRVVPPDNEQQACSKKFEINYWNKLKVNRAFCWFLFYEHIRIHGQQNIKNVAYIRCV